MATRDEIRAQILATKIPSTKVIDLFGAQVEIRQPTLGAILDAGSSEEEKQSAIIDTLIKFTYVPGTDELVFELADADTFKTMPFGADLLRVSKAFEELTQIDFLAKNDTSGNVPTST